MTEVKITLMLGDEIARRAAAEGLLEPHALVGLIEEEIARRNRIQTLFAAADRLAAMDMPPLNDTDIDAEIQAARRARVVLDTNIVVSGLLWVGLPRRVLDAARLGQVTLYTSQPLLDELDIVLQRPKFASRLGQARVSRETLVTGNASLARQVASAAIPHVIRDDPDDDAVLACAVAAQAHALISGDKHLLGLGRYREFPILSVAEFWNILRDEIDI